MKLASLVSGRDGRLVVVDRGLTRAADAGAIAPSLQAALDAWERSEPALRELATELERDRIPSFAFDEAACAALDRRSRSTMRPGAPISRPRLPWSPMTSRRARRSNEPRRTSSSTCSPTTRACAG